jgi:hypothetical protein
MSQIFSWVFWIWGFEGGIGPPTLGDLIVPPGPFFQITKHLNLVDLAQRAKFLCGCYELEVLKVELAFQRMGDPKIVLGPRFQITKHLNLVVLAPGAKIFCRCFEFEALKVEMALQRAKDLIVPPGPRFHEFSTHFSKIISSPTS